MTARTERSITAPPRPHTGDRDAGRRAGRATGPRRRARRGRRRARASRREGTRGRARARRRERRRHRRAHRRAAARAPLGRRRGARRSTVNGTGTLRVRVGRDPADSIVAGIARQVTRAAQTKAGRQLWIERVEQRYSVLVVAGTLALLTVPLLTGAAMELVDPCSAR